MSRPKHPSRATLLGSEICVAGLALAFTALRKSTDLWCLVTRVVTFGALMWASLGAVALKGPDRTPWLGFALIGWVFFAMTHTNRILPDFRPNTYHSLYFLSESIHRDPALIELEALDSAATFASQEQARNENIDLVKQVQTLRENFTSILLIYLNIAFALVGGVAGRSFASRLPASPSVIGPFGYNSEKEKP